MDNPEKLAIKGTQDEEKHNTICAVDTTTRQQTQTKYKKTKQWALLQTTGGGKYQPNIVFMRKS